MNWKRGLTRIYAVTWVVYALICLNLPFSMINARKNNQAIVDQFLREYPHLSLAQLETQEASKIMEAQAPPGDDDYLVSSGVLLAQAIARQEDFSHPLKSYAAMWGIWAMIALFPPALIFAVTSWITRGFAKN